MKVLLRILSIALLATLAANPSHAGLLLEIVSDPALPAGQTRWTFSGSSTYSQIVTGGKIAGPPITSIEEWKGDAFSDFVKTGTYNNYTTSILSGAFSVLVTPVTGGSLSGTGFGLHIDHDTSGDDFGIGLSTSDIPLSDLDTVTWSGSAVFNVDPANLNSGIFNFLNLGGSQDIPGQIYGTLPVTMVVTVPEPASFTLIATALAGLSFRKFYNRRRQS